MDKQCDKCRWHAFDDYMDDYYCANTKSDEYSCYTRYNDTCEEFEDERHRSNSKIH